MNAGLSAILLFVGGLGGVALKAFWSKKAENYATKQDVAELTEIAKRVEAKVSGEEWDRQKRWELKRDVLFDMVKHIENVYDALNSVWANYSLADDPSKAGDANYEMLRIQAKASSVVAFGVAASAYDVTLGLVAVVCEKGLEQSLRDLMIFLRGIQKSVQDDPKTFPDSWPQYTEKTQAINAMLRKELRVDQVD